MTSAWALLLVASLGCYGLKLAGVSLPKPVLNDPELGSIVASWKARALVRCRQPTRRGRAQTWLTRF